MNPNAVNTLREAAEAAYGRGERNEAPARRSTRQGGRLPVDEPTSDESTADDMQTIELDTRTDEHVSSNHETRK